MGGWGAPCRNLRLCGRSLHPRRLDRAIATMRATRTTHPRRLMSRRTFTARWRQSPRRLAASCVSIQLTHSRISPSRSGF